MKKQLKTDLYGVIGLGRFGTALVQTLIRSIEDLTEDKIEYSISPGWADIKYGNLSEKAKTLVDSFFVGICMIADEYPDCVRIV